MKYNGRYHTLFCGSKLDIVQHVRKKRAEAIKGKKLLSKVEALYVHFNPIFSVHAIERLAQRIQKPRYMDVCLDVGNIRITGPLLGPWLDPSLVRHAIDDMKSNVARQSYVSSQREEIAIRGKLAYYIVNSRMEVITILPDEYADGQWYTRYRYKLSGIDYAHRFFNTPKIFAKV